MSRIAASSFSSPTGRARLILERYRRGWSQQELADRLGTTPLNVSRWERRLTNPSAYFRRRLVALFDMDEIELDLIPGPTLRAETPTVPEALDELSATACYDPAIPTPAFSQPLVGRLEEITALRERLLHPRKAALLALNGLPGVGKTALAVALAHDPQVREAFADGMLWAALGPDAQVLDVLTRWGSLLGVSASETRSLSSLEAWTRLLRGRIGSRRMLVVLDDAWRVEDITACQVGGPDCAYLLTTRSPQLARQLTVDGTFPVSGLDEEQSMHLVGKLAPEAASLEPEQVRSLVRLVGGLPLALTLMGNYLRLQAYNGQPRRIRAALRDLHQTQRRLQMSWCISPQEVMPSYITMTVSVQAAIMMSEQHLSTEAQTALYALSVFPPRPGSFTEEAALAVCQQPVEVLDMLSDAGLLESVGEERYALHQTIADYARVRLTEKAPKERLVSYGVSYASRHSDNYVALEQESAMIEAALKAASELEEWEELARGVRALTPFWEARGLCEMSQAYRSRSLGA